MPRNDKVLKSKGLANENTKVKRIIEYLKTDTKGFNYQVVRAYGLKRKIFIQLLILACILKTIDLSI